MEQKIKFELERLSTRDEASIIAEMQRVAKLVPDNEPLSVNLFDRYSRIHSATLRRRFGGWRQSLEIAGLGHRFDDSNRPRSREELICEIREIAERVGFTNFTRDRYKAESGAYASALREFGSWRNALDAAAVPQRKGGVRYTEEECFENLFSVWLCYGRPPQHDEMKLPPSIVGPKAYTRRWGTWLKALEAFVSKANQTESDSSNLVPEATVEPITNIALAREPRDIPLGTRYKVLIRDRSRCALCGRSPATELTVELHIDHIIPWAKGGSNVEENLRLLCKECNLGKSDGIEAVPID